MVSYSGRRKTSAAPLQKPKNLHTKYLLEKLMGRHLLYDPCINGRIILKLILKNQGVRVWTGYIWHRIPTGRKPL
jgi:hypothetical protein